MVRETNGRISELIMAITGEDEPFLMIIQGDIDLAKISKISKSMDIEGFDNLENVKNK